MKKAVVLCAALAVLAALTLTGCGGDGKDLEEKATAFFDKVEDGFEDLEDRLDELDDRLSGTAEAEPEPTPAPEPTPGPEATPEPAPTQAPAEAASDSGIRPEIKEAIDSYEQFFSRYVDFMESYDASNVSVLGEYVSFMEQYAETMQKLDEMENADLTDAETVYLTQAMLRIDQMLLEAAS